MRFTPISRAFPPPAFDFRNAQHRLRRSAGPHEPRGSRGPRRGWIPAHREVDCLGSRSSRRRCRHRVSGRRAGRTADDDSIERLGRRAFAVRADLTRVAECRRIVETAVRKLGRIDILINNVGEWVVESVASMDAGTWRRIVDSNLTATFLCSKYAVPHMLRRGWGRIVNLGAAGAYRAHGSAQVSAFYAAKAGIVAFSKSLAREVGAYGITVNVVAPSVIEDPELPLADARRRKNKRLAIPRVGTGEDVANAVLFLVSEEAEFVTGDVLGVAEGWLL